MPTSNIGTHITYFREKLGLTQDELAARVGIMSKHLNNIEDGSEQPSIPLLARIAVAMGISLEEFYKMKNPNSSNTFKF